MYSGYSNPQEKRLVTRAWWKLIRLSPVLTNTNFPDRCPQSDPPKTWPTAFCRLLFLPLSPPAQPSVKAEAPCTADKQEQETAQYRQVLIETRIMCPADG